MHDPLSRTFVNILQYFAPFIPVVLVSATVPGKNGAVAFSLLVTT